MTSSCATLIKDSTLLSHLSSGDLVALTGHYNREPEQNRDLKHKYKLKLKENCQELPSAELTLYLPRMKQTRWHTNHCSSYHCSDVVKFNSVKHRRKQNTSASSSVRHAQETPVPIFVGMMLYAHTCKRELKLTDRLSQLGVSISYDCILCLTAQMGTVFANNFIWSRWHVHWRYVGQFSLLQQFIII